ncbi:hypothetical protein EON66_00735 [archaeon]|nr:MAG: hypothetical protein EON66_00735 [archaeon]
MTSQNLPPPIHALSVWNRRCGHCLQLFDLAGITCGHFGIPFATFFGATFIGKAVIKVSIQVFAIIATIKFGPILFARAIQHVPSGPFSERLQAVSS